MRPMAMKSRRNVKDGVMAPVASETLGAAQVRAQHSALILRLLWKTREISRADLARTTGLSRSTISAIVADLLETGLVREARAGESRGGRKPILLEFDDDAYFLIGIDMGATHISVLVTNLRAETRAWHSKSCSVRLKPEATLESIQTMVQEALDSAQISIDQVLGMGVSVPSPIDPAAPGKLHPLILPSWKDIDLEKSLREVYGAPVFIDNDANLGALAEVWWGDYEEDVDLAYIKVATGIGAGLIIGGRIHRGRQGTAGEIGHVSLNPNGPRCVCGLNGCINTLIGSKNLLQRAQTQLDVYPESALVGRRRLTIDRLVDAALQSDPLACDVIGYAGRTLGIGVANMLNLLAPDVVVLGGGITRAQEAFLEPLKNTIMRMSLASSMAEADIEISRLGVQGVALGAATMALEAALDHPTLFQSRRLASA